MLRFCEPEERAKLIMSVGTHRKDRPYTPLEVAERIDRELAHGNPPGEVARALHLTVSMISRFRKLLSLSSNVQHLIDWEKTNGSISMTLGFEIARLESSRDQNQLAQVALTHKLTKAEIQHVVSMKSRQGISIADGTELALKTRPEVVDLYAFFGVVHNDTVRRSLSSLSQQERDFIFQKCLSEILGEHFKHGGRLGITQYSLVGNSDLADAIHSLAIEIEDTINTSLGQTLGYE